MYAEILIPGLVTMTADCATITRGTKDALVVTSGPAAPR